MPPPAPGAVKPALLPHRSRSVPAPSRLTPGGYWAVQKRAAEPRDLGHKCRECREPFRSVGSPLWVRRGGRIELRYHAECFSGDADPRTQCHSSFARGAGLPPAAPAAPYRKMRTSSQF